MRSLPLQDAGWVGGLTERSIGLEVCRLTRLEFDKDLSPDVHELTKNLFEDSPSGVIRYGMISIGCCFFDSRNRSVNNSPTELQRSFPNSNG